MTRKTIRSIGTLLAALLVCAALCMNVAIIPAPFAGDISLPLRIANLLRTMYQALPQNQAMLCFLLATAYLALRRWLWRRLKPGEAALALLFAGWTLCSMAVNAAQTVQILWANSLQLTKSLLTLAGLTLAWLAAIRALEEALEWLARRAPAAMKRPVLKSFLILCAVWLPQMALRYPGAQTLDTKHQLLEFYGELPFTSHHPPLHTVLVGLCVRAGEALGNPELGLFVITLVQTLALALILAYWLGLLVEWRAPDALVYGLLALFALCPVYSAAATNVVKDSAYTISLLLFTIQTALLVWDEERFWRHGARNLFWWVSAGALAMLTRKNGVGVVLPTAFAVAIWAFARRADVRRRVLPALCAAAVAALSFGTEAAVKAAYHVTEGSIAEMFSLPFQQVALVVRDKGVTDEERAIIDRVLDADTIGEVYDYSIADPVKGTFRQEASVSDLTRFFGLWLKLLARYPGVCLDGLMGHMHEMFGVINDSSDIYSPSRLPDSIARLQTWGFRSSGLADGEIALRYGYRLFSRLPGIGLLTSTGFYSTLTLALSYLGLHRKNKRLWLAWIPSLTSMLVLLICPLCSMRYAWPIMFAAPVLLALSCMERREQSLR